MLSRYWWSLPRKEKEIKVHYFSIPVDLLRIQRSFELLCAKTKSHNQENEGHLNNSNFHICGILLNGHKFLRHTLDVTITTTRLFWKTYPRLFTHPNALYTEHQLYLRMLSHFIPLGNNQNLRSLRGLPSPR
uniref:Uncharacterized protein n=1 Tax=Annulohypoxylon stygium TaxID=326628 RepID=A0A386RW35_9PEZI|nr:hypothetical protein [Annulohypoxylon stygium]